MQTRSERRSNFKDFKGQVDLYPGSKYPHQLNFYDKPPLEDISIEEFEVAALDRLRVLAEIESCFARNRSFKEMGKHMATICEKYLPLNTNDAEGKGKDVQAQRRKDHIGHFVLRLAFCRTPDLRRRFVKAEETLFRIRYEETQGAGRESFLNSRDFNWVMASPEEVQNLDPSSSNPPSGRFYKVKWTRVPDLVEKRKVILQGGMAYVPAVEQAGIVFEEFKLHLDQALEATAKALPRLDEDTRLVPILDNLSRGFQAGVSSEWSGADGAPDGTLTAEMIDEMAYKHFPACMRNLHMALRKDKHLKHFGRLQYGLFLKVLGLSIDEAIAFWRKAFSRADITDDKFNKEYRYNIRHSYGLEGKRANYAAKSCQQIIMGGSGSSEDNHGCPYIHFAPENLQSALLTMYGDHGLSSMDMPEIMSLVKAKHYHVACTRVFEITHAQQGVKKNEGIGGGESVTHPNQYAARSRELVKKEEKEADGDVVMG